MYFLSILSINTLIQPQGHLDTLIRPPFQKFATAHVEKKKTPKSNCH